ncbi:MAG: sugar isomerase, partial [Phycisphaeraceae bacterium]
PEARKAAMEHTLWSVEIGAAVGPDILSMWLADGTNYPGQDSMLRRKRDLDNAFRRIAEVMREKWPEATMLVEYKPFEPGFYHTDIADWGMAHAFARHAGSNAKVLVDTGHHLPATNIEHIVAFLLDEGMLGGFHFNDRKYADDDLTMGSIDPYGAFRIFDQIAQYEFETGEKTDIAYMVDQSHNLKPKIEAMVQTVMEAQKYVAKAQLVDREALAEAQKAGDIVGAETQLKKAYETDVTGVLAEWRKNKGLAPDPLEELRTSGALEELGKQRKAEREARGEVATSSYA